MDFIDFSSMVKNEKSMLIFEEKKKKRKIVKQLFECENYTYLEKDCRENILSI